MCQDMRTWANLNVSWFDRAVLIMMTLLHRILYVMQMVPIHVPSAFFSTYKRECTIFLWCKKLVILPKLKVGIGLSDLYSHCRACLLSRLVDWNAHAEVKG